MRIGIAAFLSFVFLVSGQLIAQVPVEDLTDFQTAINTPEVSSRAARDIRSHMADIRNVLVRRGADAGFYRDNQVVKVVIPVSELFGANEQVLRDGVSRQLDVYSDLIALPTMYRLVVAVFSDDTGDDSYKAGLTSARADALHDYFEMLRGSGKELNLVSFGLADNFPAAPNDNIANRAMNRRVELYIVPEWQMIEMSKSGRLKRE